jgi:hypothetical protein
MIFPMMLRWQPPLEDSTRRAFNRVGQRRQLILWLFAVQLPFFQPPPVGAAPVHRASTRFHPAEIL